MLPTCRGIAALLFALVAPSAAGAVILMDDFDDGFRDPSWMEIEDDPARLAVAEQNGRLEVLASPGGAMTDDALYLSAGPPSCFLRTDSDFAMQIDFQFGSVTTPLFEALSLTFGLGTTVNGDDSLSFGYGWAGVAAGYVAGFLVDDAQTILTPIANPLPASGTLYISYDAILDEVYLSSVDYGAVLAQYTLPNLVRGTWGADRVLVAFGARGSGLTLASGDAWLDDFQIVSGVVVPEPATGALVAAGLLALAWGCRRAPRV